MPSELRILATQAWIVASREYLEKVRSRAFLLTTIGTPLLLGMLLGGGSLLAGHNSQSQSVAILGNDPTLTRAVATELAEGKDAPAISSVQSPVSPSAQATLNQQVANKTISGYLLLAPAKDADAQYISASSTDIAMGERLESALERARTLVAMRTQGIAQPAIAAAMQPAHVATEHLRDNRILAANQDRAFGTAYSLVFLLYMVVLIYSMNVARSVVQEKTSRIYEVLLATARADSLMAGKLLGVSAAVLTQVGIWVLLLLGFVGSSLATQYGLHGLDSLGISLGQLAYFVTFFLLGFLFYSGISAGVGALLGAEQELQQFAIFIILPLVISVAMIHYVLLNPNTATSFWLSLIPAFSPIIMYLRICAQTPPLWQIALSIGLLVLSIAATVWVAARIYRIGILMYGKRPTLPEALRWLRQS